MTDDSAIKSVLMELSSLYFHCVNSFRIALRYGVRLFQTDLRMKPLRDECSYSCRRAYASSDPYSHTPCSSLRGLATMLARRSPLSTGALDADSFAILRVYVSVILSALSNAACPATPSIFLVSASTPVIFTFNLTLSPAQ